MLILHLFGSLVSASGMVYQARLTLCFGLLRRWCFYLFELDNAMAEPVHTEIPDICGYEHVSTRKALPLGKGGGEWLLFNWFSPAGFAAERYPLCP